MAIAAPPSIKRIPMSLEEFERLPEGPPFYDYINGEAIELNKPTGRHQRIEMRLSNTLFEFTSARSLGEVYHQIDVKLPVGNWVGPDIVFIAAEHLDRYDEKKGDLYGAPDLAVEITSPSTAEYDRIVKFEQYRLSEVPWIWIVDQDSLAVEEYQWTPSGYLRIGGALGSETFRPRLFEGLEIDLAGLTGY
jgi:Uma2 family endonuclease